MRRLQPKWLSIFLSIPAAFIVAPLLMQVSWLHYFLVYSVFSHFENIFLLTLISVYGLSQLVIYRIAHGHWKAVLHTIVFYIVSAQAILVLGLASLALLWVVPMALLLFSDSGRDSWLTKSSQVNV
jgi:hypothetical protein